MIFGESARLWSRENCRSWSSSGSLRMPVRVHGLQSVHTVAQRLVILVLDEVGTAVDAWDNLGGGAMTVSFSKSFPTGRYFGHSLLVAGKVGGGVRDSERTSLKCTTLDRRDDVGEGARAGEGDGVSNLGTESTILVGVSEVMRSFCHGQSPWGGCEFVP